MTAAVMIWQSDRLLSASRLDQCDHNHPHLPWQCMVTVRLFFSKIAIFSIVIVLVDCWIPRRDRGWLVEASLERSRAGHLHRGLLSITVMQRSNHLIP